MTPKHRAYQRARDALLRAQAAQPAPFRQDEDEELPAEIAAIVVAEADLRAAEDAVADDLQAAWERNRRAVAETKEAIATARREYARIEVQVGNEARRRFTAGGGVGMVTLIDDERALVAEAREKVAEALDAHDVALARFKDGVTADQLAEA